MMKKKLVCLVLALCACLALAVPAHAQDDGYAITSYAIQATLHENNTVSQTEDISVFYNESRHGIFRIFPQTVNVWKMVDGTYQLLPYKTKIKDVTVQGAPFDTYSEDGYFYIRIGDKDSTVSGAANYRITFTYDIGDDRVSDYDELYYSVLGPDWDTTIDNFSFTLNFEKPLPTEAMESLALYGGEFGSKENAASKLLSINEASEHSVSGYAPATLPPQNAITVYAKLPEGYFVGERTVSMLPAWIALALLAALGAYTLVRATSTPQHKPVETVEFYPPEGMTSAEVGYIVDGAADDKDLISLVVWLADKGCLEIVELEAKKKNVLLRKTGELPDGVPPHVQEMFSALFPAGRTERNLRDTDEAFYAAFGKTKESLTKYFTAKERQLYHPSSRTRAFLLPFGCILLWGAAAFFAACQVELWPVIGILIAMVLLLICTVIMGGKTDHKFFQHTGSRALGMIIPILCVCGAVFAALVTEIGSLLPTLLLTSGALLTSLCCLTCGRLIMLTTYRMEMSGKLLGLRNFIEKAELPRLKLLLADNPSYFYNVLPYAYVFGLSDKWVGQFETLAIEPPVWYRGSNLYGYLWFDYSMRQHLSAAHQAVLETQSRNSGSGGSMPGSGGGGFSGGGFGGGGGGSW